MKDLANKLDTLIIRHKEIEKNLSEQNNLDKNALIQLNKEYAELIPIVEKIKNYQECKKNIQDLLELQNDSDLLIRNEAEKELKKENLNLKLFEANLIRILIPKDTNDEKNSLKKELHIWFHWVSVGYPSKSQIPVTNVFEKVPNIFF